MRAIDFLAKGNVIRVFLSNKEDLSKVHGDDWNDSGQFETVYSDYVDGYKDYLFPFGKTVCTCEGYINAYKGCKNDMKAQKFPMFVVTDKYDRWCSDEFETMSMGRNNDLKIYFGDEMEPDVISPYGEDDNDRWNKYDWMRKQEEGMGVLELVNCNKNQIILKVNANDPLTVAMNHGFSAKMAYITVTRGS